MNTVILDDATNQKLLAAGEEFELRTESGKLIAQFVRVDESAKIIAELEADPSWPSVEELHRRACEERQYSSEEVLEAMNQIRREMYGS